MCCEEKNGKVKKIEVDRHRRNTRNLVFVSWREYLLETNVW